MISRGGGLPVSWDRGGKGGKRGGGRVPLSKRVLLGKKVPLGKKIVF